MGSSLFISDLHLSPQRPSVLERFQRFLREEAPGADRLYILGDLFDAWIGDDAISPPLDQIATALGALVASGTPVDIMHGNRDFLLGEKFCRTAGCHLLDDPTLADLQGTPTLLMHGDLLCTDDTAYQQFRRQVRDPAFIRDFLARPITERRAMAAEYRRRSGEANSMKASEIMDVNQDAVAEILRRHGAVRLIHGHTHRPGRHTLEVDGHPAERWVLPEWTETQWGYLEVAPEGPRLRLI